MQKTIKGLEVKVNVPEGKVFCGFYIVDNKNGVYTIFGQCDKETSMVTTDGYEIIDVIQESSIPYSDFESFRKWIELEGWYECCDGEYDNFEDPSCITLTIEELYAEFNSRK